MAGEDSMERLVTSLKYAGRREVKVTATMAEKGVVGSGNLRLIGEALGKSRDELIEECGISGREVLQPDKPQQPREHRHRIRENLRLSTAGGLQSHSITSGNSHLQIRAKRPLEMGEQRLINRYRTTQ